MIPTSSAWLRVVWLLHTVVTMEVAKAPDKVRRKFMRPAAESISRSSTLPSAIVVVGMKKKGRAKPITSSGSAMSQKPMSVLARP